MFDRKKAIHLLVVIGVLGWAGSAMSQDRIHNYLNDASLKVKYLGCVALAIFLAGCGSTLPSPHDIGPNDADVAAFADRFARNAFDRLASEVQTATSVVVYDVNATDAFRASVAGAYDRTLTMANGMPASVNHCDCADDSVYARPEMSRGLTVLYRAPRFGRMKNNPHHSGWECWHIGEASRAMTAEHAGGRP